MARLFFDKLCERKAVYDDYLYREVAYNYEFLEDYQDVYDEFRETNNAASKRKKSIRNGGATAISVKPHMWGPKVYRYKTHPLYLMVSMSSAIIPSTVTLCCVFHLPYAWLYYYAHAYHNAT